jgi:NAD(P)-dependent dehydrogenase (short-subunit alcohol dehydrogenase family)
MQVLHTSIPNFFSFDSPRPLCFLDHFTSLIMRQTWLVVGASRGIGLEFVSQLLHRGDTVIATVRAPPPSKTTLPPPSQYGNASQLWSLTGTPNGHNLKILECDVSNEESIKSFTEQVRKLGRKGGVLEKGVIDVVVLNAGVLVYPNRISEM